jgi:hypothetical protein
MGEPSHTACVPRAPAQAATWHPHAACMRCCVCPQAEFEAICGELGVDASLEQLEMLLKRQPELPDGTRVPLTSVSEARDLIAEATLPAKRQHKAALQEALRELEEENASLQAQYIAALPGLQAASAEINACKALVEKVSRQKKTPCCFRRADPPFSTSDSPRAHACVCVCSDGDEL